MSNIAEGFQSSTQGLFIDFLGRAKGPAGKVRCQLYIALDRHYLTRQEFDAGFKLAGVCSKQLARSIRYLESRPNTQRIEEEGVLYDCDV